MGTYSGEGLLAFLDWAGEKGLMNKNSAAALKSTCAKLLEIQDGWQSADMTEIDLDELMKRFIHLKGMSYNPRTLDTYRQRFQKARDMYIDYRNNPAGWKGVVSSTKARSAERSNTPARKPPSNAELPVGSSGRASMPGADMVEYPFPLRQDCLARLVLPADLKMDEVNRLSAFIAALSIDFGRRESA